MGFTLDAIRLLPEALGYEIIGELPVLAIVDKAKVKAAKEILSKALKRGADLAKSLSSLTSFICQQFFLFCIQKLDGSLKFYQHLCIS